MGSMLIMFGLVSRIFKSSSSIILANCLSIWFQTSFSGLASNTSTSFSSVLCSSSGFDLSTVKKLLKVLKNDKLALNLHFDTFLFHQLWSGVYYSAEEDLGKLRIS